MRYDKWIEKDIIYIKDLLLENGQFMDYNFFCQTFHIQIPFTKYFGLISSIPISWKRVLQNTEEDIDADLKKNVDIILNISKVPKEVYKDLIKTVLKRPTTVIEKWNTDLNKNIPTEEWSKYFRNIYQISKATEHQVFQFKLLHRIITTNEDLYRWGLTESELCVFCEEEI